MLKIKENLFIESKIYPFNVFISIPNDNIDSTFRLYKFIEKNGKYKLSDYEKKSLLFHKGNGGFTKQLNNGDIVIRFKYWVKDYENYKLFSYLAHEIEHAVWYIFKSVGIIHTDESDEAFAYFQGYLFNEAFKFYESIVK